jgi:hypothetical protein
LTSSIVPFFEGIDLLEATCNSVNKLYTEVVKPSLAVQLNAFVFCAGGKDGMTLHVFFLINGGCFSVLYIYILAFWFLTPCGLVGISREVFAATELSKFVSC